MKAETISPPAAPTRMPATVAPVIEPLRRRPREIAAELATVLAVTSFGERVRAYRSGALSPRELALAGAWFPEEVPLLNGEYEWIAIGLE